MAINRSTAGRRITPRRAALSVGALAGLALAWTGCSIERDYKVLSFFFDGVPDPNLIRSAEEALAFAKATGGKYFSHSPYVRDQCSECHSDPRAGDLTTVDPRRCLNCHRGIDDEYAHMHGPVAATACLFCHTPHESTIEHLLRSEGPELCAQCHSAESFGKERSESHEDLTRNCLDCHSGHGGPARYFLKDGWGLERRPAATPPPSHAP